MAPVPEEQNTPEYDAWAAANGLERMARKNLVVTFIVVLITAVSTLSTVIIKMHNEHRSELRWLEEEKTKCLQDAALTIERLKNEHIKTLVEASIKDAEIKALRDRLEAQQRSQSKRRN
jgi:hypothetical protein